MDNLPVYVAFTFMLIVFIAIWLFSQAANHSRAFLIILALWVILQTALSFSGFYTKNNLLNNRFPLLVGPPLLLIVILFFTRRGKVFIDGLQLKWLTIFHVVRMPVEIVLFWLFMHKAIPQAMSFEGRNFDIFSGLSAPLVYYFGFIKKKLNNSILIAWNIICVLLLLNVVSSAVLSLPVRYQQFGFEQPNVAVSYFPFSLLPAVVVSLALFANLAALRQLITTNKSL